MIITDPFPEGSLIIIQEIITWILWSGLAAIMVNGFRKQRGLIKIKLCTLLMKLWLNYVPQKTCKTSFLFKNTICHCNCHVRPSFFSCTPNCREELLEPSATWESWLNPIFLVIPGFKFFFNFNYYFLWACKKN